MNRTTTSIFILLLTVSMFSAPAFADYIGTLEEDVYFPGETVKITAFHVYYLTLDDEEGWRHNYTYMGPGALAVEKPDGVKTFIPLSYATMEEEKCVNVDSHHSTCTQTHLTEYVPAVEGKYTISYGYAKISFFVGPADRPDISVTDVSTGFIRKTESGMEAGFDIMVKNIGGVAVSGYSYKIDFGDGNIKEEVLQEELGSRQTKKITVLHVYEVPNEYTTTFEFGADNDANAANNIFTKAVETRIPDLAVTRAEVTSKTVREDGKVDVTFEVDVENLGDIDSGDYQLAKDFGTPSDSGFIIIINPASQQNSISSEIYNENGESLAPGAKKTFTFTYTYTQGVYTAVFSINMPLMFCNFKICTITENPGVIKDLDTTNNKREVKVKAYDETKPQDIAITSIHAATQKTEEGIEVRFTVTVKNIGGQPTEDYSFSYDFGDGGTGTGFSGPVVLQPFETRTEKLAHVYAEGNAYTATFEAGTTGDGDASNNAKTQGVDTRVPDLALVSAEITDKIIREDGKVEVFFRLTVENKGSKESGTYSMEKIFGDYKFYLTGFGSPEASLLPGESRVTTFSHVYTPGVYTAKFTIKQTTFYLCYPGATCTPPAPTDSDLTNNEIELKDIKAYDESKNQDLMIWSVGKTSKKAGDSGREVIFKIMVNNAGGKPANGYKINVDFGDGLSTTTSNAAVIEPFKVAEMEITHIYTQPAAYTANFEVLTEGDDNAANNKAELRLTTANPDLALISAEITKQVQKEGGKDVFFRFVVENKGTGKSSQYYLKQTSQKFSSTVPVLQDPLLPGEKKILEFSRFYRYGTHTEEFAVVHIFFCESIPYPFGYSPDSVIIIGPPITIICPVQDDDDTNNKKSITFDVREIKKDLNLVSLETTTYYGTKQLKMRIKNSGTETITETFNVRIDIDGKKYSERPLVRFTLTPGQERVYSYVINPRQAGKEYVVTLDSTNAVEEKDESNNQKTVTDGTFVPVTYKPDLTVAGMKLRNNYYGKYLDVLIKNAGNEVVTKEFFVRLDVDGKKYREYRLTRFTLQPGQTRTASYLIPTQALGRSYKVTVDSTSVIDESNESNNAKTI